MIVCFYCSVKMASRFSHKQKLTNENLVAQLIEEKQRVEALSLSRSQFFAAASHDLRQPIHALSLYLGALTPRETDEVDVLRAMDGAIMNLQ